MRFLDSVGLIAADTSRSRAYVQALLMQDIVPACVLLLEGEKRPGQVDGSVADGRYVAPWGEFCPHRSVEESLADTDAAIMRTPSPDINAAETVNFIASRPEQIFIYSGFGGVILRSDVLATGKQFLHVHGGFLPDFKGSTTNYYSFLEEGTCGASAIFMRQELDSGPLLLRRKWFFDSVRDMDHGLDSVFRAQVLLDTIQYYCECGHWPSAEASKEEHEQSRMYYIMHPLLRHIAIFGA